MKTCENGKMGSATIFRDTSIPIYEYTPHVREAIQCIQKGIFFKELDIDFLKKNGVYML